ncbi:MAG: RidA family protein [Rikenellaceae bacterium]
MNKKVFSTSKAPKAVGPYSQAVESNGLIFVSGQLPVDVQTGEFVKGGVREQCIQVLNNIQFILQEAGCSFENIVKSTVYLTDMKDFTVMNEVYSTFYKEPFPARVAFAVVGLPKGALLEIDVIAAR